MTSSAPRRRCARCDQPRNIAAAFPEGPICSNCFVIATSTTGACPACGGERLLVGRDAAGRSICRGCAGITRRFRCAHCGDEGEIYRAGACLRCCLRSDATALLATNTGLDPTWRPLIDYLAGVPRPRTSATWLRKPTVQELLRTVAGSETPLSHATLDDLSGVRHVDHLRRLLVDVGTLPPRNEYLRRLEAHFQRQLEQIRQPDERRTVQSYLRWQRLRPLRRLDPDTIEQRHIARPRQEITVIVGLLHWLDTQQLTLSDCDQHVIDRWIATGPSTRRIATAFVQWCSAHDRMAAPCSIPRAATSTRRVVTEHDRIRLLRRLLDSDAAEPLVPRVAGIILLLYGVPFDTIQHLTVDDLDRDSDGMVVGLRLSEEFVDVPAPLGKLLRQTLAERPGPSRWLFPGTNRGLPLTRSHLMTMTRQLGINLRGGRNAALRGLLDTIPAAVLAELLGYRPGTLERHAGSDGEPRRHYAGQRARRSMTPR